MAGIFNLTDAWMWVMLVLTVVMVVLVSALLWLLTTLRSQAERELRTLYQTDVNLYLERLVNNRRLALVFRRPVLLLYRLEGYMKLGDDGQIRQAIRELDGMRLQPRDRLLFYQNRLSYFVSAGDWEEARASRDTLVDFLRTAKADRTEKYQKIIEDADQIIGVYVDRDVSLLPALKEQAAAASDPMQRGVLQYRIAKLYHFAADADMVQVYLKRAQKNLKNTYYAVMIKEALEDNTALERQ